MNGRLPEFELSEDARARMYRAALSRPDLPPAQRFTLHRGAGEIELALDEARRALAATPDWPLAIEAATLAASLGPEVAAEWEERAGRLMLERGRYREALPHLERAVSLTPAGGPRAPRQYLLSGAYLRTGATQQLDALLDQALAVELPPRDRAMLLLNRAAGRTRVRRRRERRVLTRSALAKAPSRVRADRGMPWRAEDSEAR